MPAVFVHGVPDTALVWRPLLETLSRRDVSCISLPGFGNRRPAGFSPSKDGYVSWLINELKKISGPIDLVGHDWGSLLVTRVVSLEPGLARTWCVGAAPLDPEYVWHDTARIWQTPGKGEELMKLFGGDGLARGLAAQGIPLAQARETASHIDDEMKECILALYRSAIRVSDEWFGDLKRVQAPGVVLWGENDPYASSLFGGKLATNMNGKFVQVSGTGHWYQVERPDVVATQLELLWNSQG
ncbi:MAG: alpha/beta hydrolase [Micropepsaceae bacterium]